MSTAVPCCTLRKGGLVVLEGRACKIIDLSTSSRHEIYITGTDIFTGELFSTCCCAPTDVVDVPTCTYATYVLIDIAEDDTNGTLVLLNTTDFTERHDLRLPARRETDVQFSAGIKEAFYNGEEVELTVVSAMGQDAVIPHLDDGRVQLPGPRAGH